jgi:hypothetical protein
MKERTFSILMEMVPMFQAAGIPIPPDVVEYAPLPDILIQKWKQALQPPENPQPDPQSMAIMAQIEVEKGKLQIDSQKLMLAEQQTAVDAELKKQEMEIKAQELMMSARSEAAALEVKRYEAELDSQTKVLLEQMKAEQAQVNKQLADAIPKITERNDAKVNEAVSVMLTTLADTMQQDRDNSSAQVQAILASMNEAMQSINRPKRVIYNDAGDPVGVESVG